MNLGLLGFDETSAAVIDAALRAGDRIALASGLPPDCPARAIPGLDHVTWEQFLDPESCDAVVVAAAGWGEERAAAVRALVQAGRPLLVAHPLEASMLFAYELDMIRRDSGAILVPFLPDRLDPGVRAMRDWIRARPGRVESIVLERRLRDRTRDAVQREFCRDADLARVLVGPPERLFTLGAADPDSAWSTLAVGLSRAGQPTVRWQVVRSDDPGLTITAVATDGTVRLTHGPASDVATAPTAAAAWTFDGPGGAAGPSVAADGAAAMLAVLRDALQGVPPSADPPPATWDDSARAIELAETIPRSLARGRAIDLHQEEFTELGTFKGTMASLGCGIVLAALVIGILAALVGGIARETGWEFGERIAGLWPLVVLGAMALFLLLQFLPALVATSPRPGAGETRPGDPGKP
jgi:predicted dehydrogenase